MNKQISLIIPTYGRYDEVEMLLESLTKQDCGKDTFEVIIVDQNDKIDLAPVVSKYTNLLDLTHYKTPVKGVANAKNKGMELAVAPLITFPDDDCKYYPDTITAALNFLKSHPEADIVYGRLYDRTTRKNIMRNWPETDKIPSVYNFHYTYSAVSGFIKRNELKFDTNFGVGSFYGVGEELDYLLQTFEENLKSIYTPLIDVWHPELNPTVMSPEKVYYYALGYGAICKKHLNFVMFATFMLANFFQFLQIIKALILFNRTMAYKRWLSLRGRFVGFKSYRR